MESPANLIHATRDIASLKSILENGLLFRWNDTEIVGKLHSFTKDTTPTPGGMISFTELSLQELIFADMRFGKYGICLNADWLVKRGARKVRYVDENSLEMNAIILDLRRHQPKIRSISSRSHQQIAQSLVDEKSLSGVLNQWATPLFRRLVDDLNDMQTKRHGEEREWRLRSVGIADIEKMETEQLINAIRVFPALRGQYTLMIEPKQVRFLFCPLLEEGELRKVAAGTQFAKVRIVTY